MEYGENPDIKFYCRWGLAAIIRCLPQRMKSILRFQITLVEEFDELLLSLLSPQGVGINLHDPFELFRKNKSYTYNRRERSGEYCSLAKLLQILAVG